MNILHIIPNLNKGGAQRLCLDICQELNNQGYVTKVVILEDSNEYLNLYPSVDVVYCKTSFFLSLKRKNVIDLTSVTKIVDDFKPDVIHSHLYDADIIGLGLNFDNQFCHVHGKMESYRPINYLDLLSPEKWGVMYEQFWIRKNIKKQGTSFITIGEDTKKYILDGVGNYSSNFFSLTNAIDLNRFKTAGRVEEKVPSIACLTRLFDHKGVDLIVDLAIEFKKRNFQVNIKVYGEGPEKNKLQERILENGISDIISLEGMCDLPEKQLQQSTLFFHPSKFEPFGLVILEAMACGAICFTTDGIGNRPLIKDGVNGFFFNERDAYLIMRKMIEVLKDKKISSSVQKEGLEFVKAYGIDKYCVNLTKLYKLKLKPLNKNVEVH